MAIEEYSILWSIRFAASFMRGMAEERLRGPDRKRAEKVALVLNRLADSIVAARRTHRKKRTEKAQADSGDKKEAERG